MTALAGIRVLELAETVAGEYCGKLLADLGAEVIKLERPDIGSPTRQLGPFAGDQPGTERSGLFAMLNTGKQSVEFDLAAPAARDGLERLLQRVDVLIDDHVHDGGMICGLTADTLEKAHPALITCSISNFGLNPPDDRLHASDLQVFHSSGVGYHTPSGADESLPPLKGAGRFLPSFEAGMEGALCICAAICEQESNRRGQFIEISKQEVLASRMDYVVGQMIAGDMDVSPSRHQFDLGGPAGIFRCRDGYAYVWMSAPPHWEALRQLIDDNSWMDDFPEHWMEKACTAERVALCRQHLAHWLSTQNKHEVSERAQQLGLTLVAVNNVGDLQASPQYQFREFFSTVSHPEIGDAAYPTAPYRLSATPVVLQPAPTLGQANHGNDAITLSTGGTGDIT